MKTSKPSGTHRSLLFVGMIAAFFEPFLMRYYWGNVFTWLNLAFIVSFGVYLQIQQHRVSRSKSE